jgi:hypothetical protein
MREDYQALMEKQLKEWSLQTERFKAAAGQMEEHAKAQYESNLQLLHTKQQEAWDSFRKMKDASEDAWEKFKANLDKTGAQFKDAAERMTTQFKK